MQADRECHWRGSSSKRRAVVILIATVTAMLIIGYDLAMTGRSGHGATAARVITRGYDRSRVIDPADAEDGDLSADEGDAGAMWAKSHGTVSASECPAYSVAFRRGCADFVHDAQH